MRWRPGRLGNYVCHDSSVHLRRGCGQRWAQPRRDAVDTRTRTCLEALLCSASDIRAELVHSGLLKEPVSSSDRSGSGPAVSAEREIADSARAADSAPDRRWPGKLRAVPSNARWSDSDESSDEQSPMERAPPLQSNGSPASTPETAFGGERPSPPVRLSSGPCRWPAHRAMGRCECAVCRHSCCPARMSRDGAITRRRAVSACRVTWSSRTARCRGATCTWRMQTW